MGSRKGPPKPKPRAFAHPDHPLTPIEIRTQYGPLIDAFFQALRHDVGLLAFMAERAAAITPLCERRRAIAIRSAQQRRERLQAQREIVNPNPNTTDAERAVS